MPASGLSIGGMFVLEGVSWCWMMFWLGPAMTAMLSSMFNRGVGEDCLLEGSHGTVVVTSPRFSNSLLGDCSLTAVCVGGLLLCGCGVECLGWGPLAVYGGGAGVYGGAFMFISGYSDGGCVARPSCVIDGSSDW